VGMQYFRKLLGGLVNYRRQYGWKVFCQKVYQAIVLMMKTGDLGRTKRMLLGVASRHTSSLSYSEWIQENEHLDESALANQRAQSMRFGYQPYFSIVVPTFNTSQKILQECIESVLAQSYPHWELCMADDASTISHVRDTLEEYSMHDERIKVCYRKVNGHISDATNSALDLATGDFICLMDHDDVISPNALFEFASKLNDNPDLDMIYSDEDKLSYDGTIRFEPFFKPDWSPEYLECCMYTAHFACYKADIVRKVGGFQTTFNGAQDYDFMLRFSELTWKIGHVPRILYHWRSIPGSTAASMDNKDYVIDSAILALEKHLERTGRLDFVKPSFYKGCFHVRYEIEASPKVSIVIPSAGRDSVIRGKDTDLLVSCVKSIIEKSSYTNVEIIIVDNNDLKSETSKALSLVPIKYVHYLRPEFNIAIKMNMGAEAAAGDYLLFLNDDIEVISSDWIEAMLSIAQREGVGVVGAKLFFEDNTIQHVGVAFCNGLPDHIRRGYKGDDPGYYFSSEGQRNYLAVTGACMLLKRDLFIEVGGFDEALAINYNDIDLCLKVWQKGFRNVYTGQAKLYHFESRNRKRTVSPKEQDLFYNRWATSVSPDPYYSSYFLASPPNFDMP